MLNKLSRRTRHRILVGLAGLCVPAGVAIAVLAGDPAWLILSVVGFLFFIAG